jgi:hypothetical protein
MPVIHKKVLSGATNGNPNQVQPDDWNEGHDLSGLLALLDDVTPANDRVLTLGTSGAVELLPKSQILVGESPTLTGQPTCPTAPTVTNNLQIANAAFVHNVVDALIASAPGALNTLDELAAALGDDANFAATVTTALALKAPLASPALTGNPTVPNQAALSNNTRAANTAYVDSAVAAGIFPNGAVVGSVLATYAANADLTALIPTTDAVPLVSGGTQIISQAYTPASATNKLRITFKGQVSGSVADNVVAAIFQGSTCIGAQMVNIMASNTKHTFDFTAEYTPGAVSAQTITVRVGGGAQTVRLNGSGAGRLLGGASAATLLIEEIKA